MVPGEVPSLPFTTQGLTTWPRASCRDLQGILTHPLHLANASRTQYDYAPREDKHAASVKST